MLTLDNLPQAAAAHLRSPSHLVVMMINLALYRAPQPYPPEKINLAAIPWMPQGASRFEPITRDELPGSPDSPPLFVYVDLLSLQQLDPLWFHCEVTALDTKPWKVTLLHCFGGGGRGGPRGDSETLNALFQALKSFPEAWQGRYVDIYDRVPTMDVLP